MGCCVAGIEPVWTLAEREACCAAGTELAWTPAAREAARKETTERVKEEETASKGRPRAASCHSPVSFDRHTCHLWTWLVLVW